MHDCIAVKPLLMKDIPIDSEGEIPASDVSMEDVSDSDYTIEQKLEGLEFQL